jgi:hypothetical protein
MAHTILSARPNLLSRDPPEVRSLLKHLYGSTVMAMASLRQGPVATDLSQGKEIFFSDLVHLTEYTTG